MRRPLQRLAAWRLARARSLAPMVLADTAPLDLQILGRVLVHAALVGIAAGLFGAAFFVALEYGQALLLEGLAGYRPLRAAGEIAVTPPGHAPFRPWLLVALPALGGLACGLLTRLAPETRGGGADAVIEAFHHRDGSIRKRVVWVKALASISTLATGGAGGREGPTMQVGGAIGALVARALRLTPRERRILVVAGVAAGVSAVFRTPLGAALLAVEMLYRDGFESDALVPSVLASVVSYSVVTSIFGESTLFAHAPRYPFEPTHLPLYLLLALCVAALAAGFEASLRGVRGALARTPLPEWVRPAAGGLLLGLLCTPAIAFVGHAIGEPGQGLGILGGGYGAVQISITGAEWLPEGWRGVELLLLLCAAKLLASALTIGSGGSAGDFAPSLVLGGLFGGAFGRAASLLLQDPAIDPGAFALVGMGAFYGGIAHVPLSALVLVCEMAGSYDLLVPLMLAEAVAFVALRRRTLYAAQVDTPRDSPVHRDAFVLDVLRRIRVREVMDPQREVVRFERKARAAEMLERAAATAGQDVFPVLDREGKVLGVIASEALRVLATVPEAGAVVVAMDLMAPAVVVGPDDDLRVAIELIIARGVRELLVVDESGHLLGLLDEAEINRVHLDAARRAEKAAVFTTAP
ncbi:chloride channel protein [Myxococcota bacterium]|nr:chloride channel protein [Myxococcota bacterium]